MCKWSVAVVVILVLLACVVAVTCIPVHQARELTDIKDRLIFENEARRTIFQILSQSIGGILLIFGLYLTLQQVVTGVENLKISYHGQVTDRFTKAIDQLGNEKPEVRIGGLYALEIIARDSHTNHYWPVMDTVTAFIRKNAKRAGEGAPPPDIQAALTVLGRRKELPKGDSHVIDLSGVKLESANLRDLKWATTDFSGSDMKNIDLRGSKILEKVDFKGAIIEGAHLEGVDLSYALNLTLGQIQSARTDPQTKKPEYLQTP